MRLEWIEVLLTPLVFANMLNEMRLGRLTQNLPLHFKH